MGRSGSRPQPKSPRTSLSRRSRPFAGRGHYVDLIPTSQVTEWRVKLCRESYDAWAATDFEALAKLYDPECEWDLGPMAGTGLGPVYRGHTGLREMMAELTGVFEGFAPRLLDIRRWGDRVLIRGDAIGTSHLVGAETANAPFRQVIEFTDHRILRVSQTDDPPPNWDEARPV